MSSKINLRVNTKTNVAEVMYSTDKTVYEGTAEEIARQFLQENKDVFGITNISDLKFLEVIESPGGKHVGLTQTYKGIPVYGSETVVSINDKNQIETVANGCIPVKNIKSVTASLAKANAISNAKLKIKLNEKTLAAEPKAELYVYPDSLYQMRLIWKVNFSASEPKGSWEILVDAASGEVLGYKDVRLYDTGQGKVFRPDPITALQNTSLTDQNNTDYQALQGAYVTVSLPNLNPPSGSLYRLHGSYARSEDLEYPYTTPVTNSTSSFLYNRSQPGFEETNAYYFIDAQRQYVGSLGFSPQWNSYNYIRFDAHGYTGDYSWYDPSYQYVIFGDGGIDDAEDQDVILHEYTHALHDALMVGTFQVGTNEHLLGEGIADYMAVSYRRTLSSFQPNKVFPWDGNGETWNGRTLSASYIYPANWSWSNYMGGTLWASTMMDLQNYGDMSRDIVHKLLLKSFNYASSSTIVPDHVFYVMYADQALYGESHLSSLGKAFYNRGFFDANPGVHSSNYLNGNIASSTSWSGIKYVNGNTYIKPGVTVTSYAFLFIGDRKKIVIENNATLIIKGTLTKYFLADIEVQPG
ncbi:MAG: PepSY domain-containing protein, partial [Bacteroidetes bacterium]|nr:PepSY domain-containing protein [Bacteroidota bacterium]